MSLTGVLQHAHLNTPKESSGSSACYIVMLNVRIHRPQMYNKELKELQLSFELCIGCASCVHFVLWSSSFYFDVSKFVSVFAISLYRTHISKFLVWSWETDTSLSFFFKWAPLQINKGQRKHTTVDNVVFNIGTDFYCVNFMFRIWL